MEAGVCYWLGLPGPQVASADSPGSGRGHFWGAVFGEAYREPGSYVARRTEALSGVLPASRG